ncbi:helix-turn-helix domain-containing protein [Klebsiella variicola]|uniref:helix-turn-helix domain-containing protein n=1 Tax=Klebsiella variicola TaxID=244366 RepID=UPI0009B9E624|nr:helix-turn-helix domain-containing protein [Klebsiella variicola]MEC6197865.1 helix-turn-helix domain-containing protein [Klebsiella variicola]SLZ46064.1 putative DNA-binding protein [Klebsiella variicola]HCQ8410687.1 helix-turn-helix domain-containing protein [Klebsiella variicola]
MISDAIKAANDLACIVPLLGGSSSRKDYEEARKLVEYLLEHDPDSPLVDMLTARIDAWEDKDNAVEFEEFNTRIEAGKNGVSLLRVLMQQYGLSQSDFENEIGNKSLVSRILSGERSLTFDHMRALANRFQIPVSMFID